MNDNDEHYALWWVGGIIVLLLSAFLPYPTQGSEIASIPYTISTVKDSTWEMGESFTKVDGQEGKKSVINKSTGTLLQRLFLSSTVDTEELESTVVLAPIEKQIVEGTKKYQYMYCSNNHYMSYTDEQFSNPNTGFTSRSEDACQKSGYGTKLRLADTPPAARPRCIDVTSYDYNWNNDVLCYRADGSSYYTSYEGAGW